MAMTVNPDAGISAPDTSREEAIYAFRFDLDNDAREELTSKVRLGAVANAVGEDHKHFQTVEVRRAAGDAALRGADGELIVAGHTGEAANRDAGVMVFAGLAPDLFAGDAQPLGLSGTLFSMREDSHNPRSRMSPPSSWRCPAN
jgi:hypothetical protein